jgi:hypothetical protein
MRRSELLMWGGIALSSVLDGIVYFVLVRYLEMGDLLSVVISVVLLPVIFISYVYLLSRFKL